MKTMTIAEKREQIYTEIEWNYVCALSAATQSNALYHEDRNAAKYSRLNANNYWYKGEAIRSAVNGVIELTQAQEAELDRLSDEVIKEMQQHTCEYRKDGTICLY